MKTSAIIVSLAALLGTLSGCEAASFDESESRTTYDEKESGTTESADVSQSLAVTTPMKWHPGHYYMLVGKGDNDWYMDQVHADLASTPALRGIVVRYRWSDLETAQGVYDFSAIQKHLADMTSRKLRLAILLEIKSFDTTSTLVLPT